jgi:citrate lyase subunit alpha/citrate CoA-transferase
MEKEQINHLIQKLSAQCPDLGSLRPFAGADGNNPHGNDSQQARQRKLCASLEEAIQRTGLKDGMTISFHHAFREGDKVINMVVDTLARMGFRNLTLASSSLLNANASLVEHIKSGVITQIYTSGLRGKLADAISHGLMERPVQIHSHGGRVHLLQTGEVKIDVAFLAVSSSDVFGNANGTRGKSPCGSLGYAKVDAQFASQVVLLTDTIVDFPNTPISISQDRVDYVVKIDEVGDVSRISLGAARTTNDPRELLIARHAADVIESSGYFKQGFSLQTGSGASSIAATRFLEKKMVSSGITARFALGGITSSIVELHEKGLIDTLVDTQSFDSVAAESLAKSASHLEVSANEYANPSSKGAFCDYLDVVILSALEIDTGFNVNVITGSDGVIRGASGGHCDVAATAGLTIVVAPLIRGRIPTVVKRVTTLVTPGESVDVLVTDHGIAVNPARPELDARLREAGLPVMTIEELYQRAVGLTGVPDPIQFTDRIVGVIRYRDGSVIDVVRQVKECLR